MTIGPGDIEQLANKQADEFETSTYNSIARGLLGDSRWLVVPLDSLPVAKVQRILVERYLDAGWQRVEFDEDERVLRLSY